MSLASASLPERVSKTPEPVPDGLMFTPPWKSSGFPVAVPAPLATKSPSFWSKVPLLVIVPAVWVRLDAPFQLSVIDLAAAIVIVPLVVQTDVAPLWRSSLTVSVPVLSSAPWRWLAPLFVVVEVIVPALVNVPPTMFRVPWVVSVEPRLIVPLLVCEAATSRRPWVTEGTPATRIV